MNDLASQVSKHSDHLPMIVIILIAIAMSGMVGFALYTLLKFFWNLLGFSKKEEEFTETAE